MRRNVRAAFDYCPPGGRMGVGRLAWGMWALICLVISMIPVVLFVDEVAIPNRSSYPGNLSLDVAPLTLDLPAHVPLERILVAPGDRVVAGQTLATLDRAEIELRLDALERSILIDTVSRTCLMSQEPPQLDALVEDGDEIDEETLVGIGAALEECSLHLETSMLETDRLEASREAVVDDIALLEASRRILLDQPAAGMPEKRNRASKAIALSAELNRLKAKRNTLETSRRDAEMRREQRRLERVEALTDEIVETREVRERLERYLKATRLYLPRSGRVIRVRKMAPGTVLQQTSSILEITPSDDPSYLVHFDASAEEIHTFNVEDDIRIQLVGKADETLRLRGRISGLEHSPSGAMIRVSVELDAGSVSRLETHPVAFGLETRNSAVAISVKRGNTTFLKSVQGLVAELAGTLSDGWAVLLTGSRDRLGPDMAQAQPRTQAYFSP